MTESGDQLLETKGKEATARLEEAISDRTVIESYVNEVFYYGLPGRQLMNEQTDRNDEAEQQFIYDPELQFNLREAASELKSIYTPYHRQWAGMKPRKSLSREIAENQEVLDGLHTVSEHLFEAMRMSRLDQALESSWEEWLIAAGGVQIMKGPKGRGALVENWPLREMYLEKCNELPGGIDGRWRMRRIKRRYLKMSLPMVDWEAVLKRFRKSSNANGGKEAYEISYGYRYDGDAWPKERWIFEVFFQKKLVHSRPVVGPGSVGLIPFRSAENAENPWGRGPASIALSPGRALDQIAYLILKVLPKRVDPPFWYAQDGSFNPGTDILAGDAIPASPDFQMGFIESRHRMDDLYTEVETLRTMVKRALWQDRPDPYQAGTTPPTAYQIQTQELGRAIRQERPRARINPELVLPVMNRFMRIESDAKRMPRIEIEGHQGAILVEPKSPMSRAADLEDVQQAQMLLQMVQGYMGDRGLMSLDMRGTISNIQNRLGEGALLVELGNQEDAALERGMGAAADAGGAIVGETAGAELATAA